GNFLQGLVRFMGRRRPQTDVGLVSFANCLHEHGDGKGSPRRGLEKEKKIAIIPTILSRVSAGRLQEHPARQKATTGSRESNVWASDDEATFLRWLPSSRGRLLLDKR